MDMRVDRFHFPNHVCKWCKKNVNPADSKILNGVNTEVMAQLFAWIKGYAPLLRYMKKATFKFSILDLLDRHNVQFLN